MSGKMSRVRLKCVCTYALVQESSYNSRDNMTSNDLVWVYQRWNVGGRMVDRKTRQRGMQPPRVVDSRTVEGRSATAGQLLHAICMRLRREHSQTNVCKEMRTPGHS